MDYDGFESERQRGFAQELIEQCSGFTGLAQALSGRQARVGETESICFEPGFVVFPKASLHDLPAGVAGRLGMALMGAASKLGKPAAVARRSAPFVPSDPHDDLPSDWDDPAEPIIGIRQEPTQPKEPSRKPSRIAEGEGAESLDSMVRALEDAGFGNPDTAKLIAANRAKSMGKPGR